MKKSIFLFFFLPLVAVAQAQETVLPAHQNEFGINLFSVTRFTRSFDYIDRRQVNMDINPVPGIFYKRHFGKNALRASADYTQHKVEISSGDPELFMGYYAKSGVKKTIGLAAGYERSFGSGKFQPYVFGDLIFNYENHTGHETYYGCFSWAENAPYAWETHEYGVSAGSGLRYSITPAVHLSYEFAAQGFYSVEQDVMHAGEKYNSISYHLNPVNKLAVSVSF